MAESLCITRRTIQTIVKGLKDRGIIKRINDDKGGHWEILSKNKF